MPDIRIDKSVASIPEQLTGINNVDPTIPTIKLFSNMAEVLVFAALLGVSGNRSKPVLDPRPNPIRFDVFENQKLDSYIYLLAVYKVNGFHWLEEENLESAITNFESYAFGGLEIISEWVQNSGRGLFEAILDKMADVASEVELSPELNKPKPKIIIKRKRDF